MSEVKHYTDKAPDEITEQDMKDMWADVTESINKHNREVGKKNNRVLRAIRNTNGKAFVNNMLAVLEHCEAIQQMGFIHEYKLVREHGEYPVETNEFGRKIRTYWVDQWAVGDSGDSWSGYVYIELKKGLYLKCPYDM